MVWRSAGATIVVERAPQVTVTVNALVSYSPPLVVILILKLFVCSLDVCTIIFPMDPELYTMYTSLVLKECEGSVGHTEPYDPPYCRLVLYRAHHVGSVVEKNCE